MIKLSKLCERSMVWLEKQPVHGLVLVVSIDTAARVVQGPRERSRVVSGKGLRVVESGERDVIVLLV